MLDLGHGHPNADLIAWRASAGVALGSLLAFLGLVQVDGPAHGLIFIATLVVASLVLGGLGWWTAAREGRLREQALRQPVTGLLNPQLFDERLREEVQRALRHRYALSLLVIDLDSHGRFVERGGAAAGERMLHDVAKKLRSTCRGGDFVVHRGRDEFMVVAPYTTAMQANLLAHRLRSVIEGVGDALELGIDLTPSIGAAELVASGDGSGKALLEAAQQALLIARVRHCGVSTLGHGEAREPERSARVPNDPSSQASIRETEVIDADGQKTVALSIYCPDCQKWHNVEGRRRTSWADRTLRTFNNRPFAATSAADTRVADVMERDVVCVRPEMSIQDLSELFLEHGITGAPVLDRQDNLIGFVTTADILRNAWDPQTFDRSLRGETVEGAATALEAPGAPFEQGRATVADVMSPIVFKLTSDASMMQVAALMAYESVQRIVVVTPDGKVEGTVSAADVLRWVAHAGGYAVPTAPEERVQPERRSGRPGPILVVDDDDDLRQGLAEMLTDEGYEVVTAANGAEALQFLHLSAAPSLILLDLSMPVMGGATLCAELSKDPALDRIPLILLSGVDRLAREVGKIDADAFLSKPVEADRLLGTVRRYC